MVLVDRKRPEDEHGLLAPVATIEGTGLRRRTRRALVATYGEDAVEAGGPAGPDFRVDGGLVTLTVVLARTAEEAVAAVGRAMAHATVPGDVPVVAYPADERTDELDRLARRVPLVPVETRADRA